MKEKKKKREEKNDRRNYERIKKALKIIVDNCNEDRPRWRVNEIALTRLMRVTPRHSGI